MKYLGSIGFNVFYKPEHYDELKDKVKIIGQFGKGKLIQKKDFFQVVFNNGRRTRIYPNTRKYQKISMYFYKR